MENVNIKELNDRIQKESAFVDIIQMEMNKVPKAVEGMPLALITAGLLSMAFMGFSGVDGGLKLLFGLE